MVRRLYYNKIMERKIPLVNGQIYHIFSRSIAEYVIFNNKMDYLRMQQMLKFYQKDLKMKYSFFMKLKGASNDGFDIYYQKISEKEKELVQVIAYCLMPTHIHLILKQLTDKGVSQYCGNIFNSYARYFNIRHKRGGPLWGTRFKNVLVTKDEQLLHLTRYIHLNPVTANIINKPEEWNYSSYREYLNQEQEAKLCDYEDILNIKPKLYSRFVNDRISYQRELAKIKTMILD